MVDVRYSERIAGQVIKRNFCHPVAPSTLAASYCSLGIASRPAPRINVQNGRLFHTCISIEKPSASVGSLSQLGPSRPVSLKIVVLITPHSGLSMKRTDRMVGIDGTAHGMMNSTDSTRIHQRSCTKKQDSPSATIIFRWTATTMKMTVLIAVRKKIGSSNRCT